MWDYGLLIFYIPAALEPTWTLCKCCNKYNFTSRWLRLSSCLNSSVSNSNHRSCWIFVPLNARDSSNGRKCQRIERTMSRGGLVRRTRVTYLPFRSTLVAERISRISALVSRNSLRPRKRHAHETNANSSLCLACLPELTPRTVATKQRPDGVYRRVALRGFLAW